VNDIPLTGVLYHSDGDDTLHSHNLYIMTWDGRPVHTHEFKGVTSFNVGHDHRYAGTTKPAPSGIQHTHRYTTFTTFDAEHRHVIRGITGPAIPLPGGGHYHEFSGVTPVDGATPHRHRYEGRTSD
jgi:hypothetical protein